MDFSGIEKLPLQKRTRSLFDDVLDTKLKRPKRSGRKTERARMLCLDGGGIKGLVLTRYVLYFFEVTLIKIQVIYVIISSKKISLSFLEC